MKIAYLHYLYGKQAGLHHVRQFVEAARRVGSDVDVHAMHPIGEGDAAPGRSSSQVLKRYLGRYLHDPKELLMSWPYAAKELRLQSVPQRPFRSCAERPPGTTAMLALGRPSRRTLCPSLSAVGSWQEVTA